MGRSHYCKHKMALSLLSGSLLLASCYAAPLPDSGRTNVATPWALSLSGNGFVAMGHGAGVYKALHNAGFAKDLATISSVSGGSWLNTMLSFSSSFHEGLIAEEDIGEFFMNYQAQCAARGATMQPTECMRENGAENCWTDFVGAFLYSDPATPATPEHRLAGATNAELLIATNIATQSLMSDGSTTTLLDVTEVELPAYYSIPAAYSGQHNTNSSWSVPFALGAFPMVQRDDGSTSTAVQSTLGRDNDARTQALQLPTLVNVHAVGAMSSSAIGAAGAPGIKAGSTPTAQFCDWFPCPHVKNDNFDNSKHGNVAESAICSDSSQGAHCSFPSVRFIDGCYSDNTGLALNIGHLQKRHPGEMLSIFVVNSNQCDRSKDAECMQSIHESTFRNLFSDSPYPDVASEGWIDAGAGINVPTVNRVIFEQVISDEQALGKAVGTEGVTVMTGTFTTLDNQAFGVSAGTSVRLVVFNANSAAPLQPASPDDMVKLSAVAKNSFAVATSVLQGEHSGVESTGALSLKAPTPDVEALEIGAAKPVGVSLAPFWLGTLVGVVLAATAFVGALFTMRVMMTKKDAATACQRNMIVVEHETSSPDYEPL